MTPAHVHEKEQNDPLFIVEASRNVNLLTVSGWETQSDLRGELVDDNGTRARITKGTTSSYLIDGGLDLDGQITDSSGNHATVVSVVSGNLTSPNPVNGSANGLESPASKDLLRASASSEHPIGRALVLENIDGFDSLENFRKSPHLINLKHTAPFGLSGEFETLTDFSCNAVAQHFTLDIRRREGIDFRFPTTQELEALTAFQESFEIDITNGATTVTNPDFNVTTNLQRTGSLEFTGVGCLNCHSGRFLNTSRVTELRMNTGVASQDVNTTDQLPTEPPTAGANTRSFEVPQLIGIRHTAPYFHDNSANTLEDVIGFYESQHFKDAFPDGQFGIGGVLANPEFSFPPDLRAGLVAFLKTLADYPVEFPHFVSVGKVETSMSSVNEVSITNSGSSAALIIGAIFEAGSLAVNRFDDEIPNLREEFPLPPDFQSGLDQEGMQYYAIADSEIAGVTKKTVTTPSYPFFSSPVIQITILDSLLGYEIAPGETLTIPVTFAPTEIRSRIDTNLAIRIQNAEGDWDFGIHLVGAGIPFNPPPVFTNTINDIVKEIEGSLTEVTLPEPQAEDDGNEVTFEVNAPENGMFPLGETIVTETVTDEKGKAVSRSYAVTIVDTQNPISPHTPPI
ncbi:MAG: hypothetical protein OEZ43_21615 [Gammaproteobacteria bacterium]|nr:hypothetical protein [Gammaproteobacteria bacterium]